MVNLVKEELPMADYKLYDKENHSVSMEEKSIPEQFSDMLNQKYQRLEELKAQGQHEDFRIAEDKYLKYEEIYFEYDVELTGFDQHREELLETHFSSQGEFEAAAKKLEDHIKTAEERKMQLEKEMSVILTKELSPPHPDHIEHKILRPMEELPMAEEIYEEVPDTLPAKTRSSIESHFGSIEYLDERIMELGHHAIVKDRIANDFKVMRIENETDGQRIHVTAGFPDYEQALGEVKRQQNIDHSHLLALNSNGDHMIDDRKFPPDKEISSLKIVDSPAGLYIGREQFDMDYEKWMPLSQVSGIMDREQAEKTLEKALAFQKQLEPLEQGYLEFQHYKFSATSKNHPENELKANLIQDHMDYGNPKLEKNQEQELSR